MSKKTIALVAAFMVSCTLSFAQSSQGKAGSENGPASNSVNTTDGMKQDGAGKMKTGTTGNNKDASTQGAGTAGSAEKKGDATTPGGTMKK